MSSTFPRTRKSRRGYAIDQVDEFLEDARRAYNAEPGSSAGLASDDIRRTSFALQKGGYSPTHVDAALERLEDAFANRERESARAQLGDQAWFSMARTNAKEIIDRLARPKGKRFRRAGLLRDGYDPKQVDAFAQRLSDYFLKATPMSVDEVRLVAFRPAKGGYTESQVDYFLDSVISVMLAVR
ncbi:MAG: DivIVA domain-containing protein [Microbacteriaceae bacterium]|nr:DivIVA domain-containing protein [Microbacteriaceae bacterium]